MIITTPAATWPSGIGVSPTTDCARCGHPFANHGGPAPASWIAGQFGGLEVCGDFYGFDLDLATKRSECGTIEEG